MTEVSVVIPAYLEEENLRLLLPRLHSVLEHLGVSYEILIVDTESPMDSTAEVCAEHGAIYSPRKGGNSYGCAVRSGIAASQGEKVIFMDADGSHAPEFIANLFTASQDADIVIASRYVKGGATENPGVLIFMSRILNVLYRVCLGLKCQDVSNSFKLYEGSVLRSLTLECENFDVVEEVLVRYTLAKRGAVIKELPFVFKKRMFGQTKRNLPAFLLSFLITLGRLMAIRFRYRVQSRRVTPPA
jgi:dolichol-phosphate mannosyltransferase